MPMTYQDTVVQLQDYRRQIASLRAKCVNCRRR